MKLILSGRIASSEEINTFSLIAFLLVLTTGLDRFNSQRFQRNTARHTTLAIVLQVVGILNSCF